MAYQIVYDPEYKRKYPAGRNKKPVAQYIAAISLLAAIVLLLCYPPINAMLKNFLVPGDQEQTISATKELIASLKAGNTVGESLMVFCMEIINGAQY